MNSTTNDSICDLMAENGGMKMLLSEMLPHIDARINGFKQSYFGGENEISKCLRENEDFVRRMREFLRDFEV